MVVGEPGGLVAIVPEALQVRGQGTARGGKQEIAAVVKHQRSQRGVFRSLLVGLQPREDSSFPGLSDLEGTAAHESRILCGVAVTEFLVLLRQRRLRPRGGGPGGI